MTAMTWNTTLIPPTIECTVWQCPDCFGQVQHQRAESAETLVYCQQAAPDWSRICGRRMARTFVIGADSEATS